MGVPFFSNAGAYKKADPCQQKRDKQNDPTYAA